MAELAIYDAAKLKLYFAKGRTFTCTEDNHYKFWNIQTDGMKVTTTWGRIGSKMQSLTKSFSWDMAAKGFMRKKIDEKLAKGYSEI